jgi:hypothetical protein
VLDSNLEVHLSSNERGRYLGIALRREASETLRVIATHLGLSIGERRD